MERVAFLIEDTQQRIDCLLNPQTLVFRREAGLRRRTLMGQFIGDAPWSDDVLIGGGGLMELELELLFDASLLPAADDPVDMRKITAPFWNLAERSADTHKSGRPPLARFVLGKTWNMLGVVAAVAERFENFLPDGTPQRSWLRMRFLRVADPVTPQSTDQPDELIDMDTVVPMIGTPESELPDADSTDTDGDDTAAIDTAVAEAEPPESARNADNAGTATQGRLDQIAFELTGNAANWRRLADYSGIDDPTCSNVDTVLRIPPEFRTRTNT